MKIHSCFVHSILPILYIIKNEFPFFFLCSLKKKTNHLYDKPHINICLKCHYFHLLNFLSLNFFFFTFMHFKYQILHNILRKKSLTSVFLISCLVLKH